jgi:hypothetical protein
MTARLATSDGIVEIAQDADDDTRPVDVHQALADEAATLRAISAAEERTIERIAAGLEKLAIEHARRGEGLRKLALMGAASFVRSRRWAVR